jgi:hypothetical protein
MLHATIHTIVENQLCLGDTFPARAVLLRLIKEGLDRHEAVHALGMVLCEQPYAMLRGGGGAEHYVECLNRLTAKSWRKQAQEA